MKANRRPEALSVVGWARVYFAVQAVAGAAWWIAVFASPPIRTATLGTLDPVTLAVFDVPLFVGASALVAAGVRHAVWVAAPWTLLVAGGMALYATLTGAAGWGALLMVAAAAGWTAAAVVILVGRVPSEWLLVGPFRFRSAAPSRAQTLVTRTAIQVLVFSLVFLVALPIVILLIEMRWGLHVAFPPAVRIGGALLFVAAFSLSMWSAASMSVQGAGTPLPSAMPRRLVIAGPYRFVRNPMAVGGIAQGVAVGVMLGSWLVVIYALSGSLVWNALVRPLEEADLEERFGAAFRDYRARVSCWVPRRALTQLPRATKLLS